MVWKPSIKFWTLDGTSRLLNYITLVGKFDLGFGSSWKELSLFLFTSSPSNETVCLVLVLMTLL